MSPQDDNKRTDLCVHGHQFVVLRLLLSSLDSPLNLLSEAMSLSLQHHRGYEALDLWRLAARLLSFKNSHGTSKVET